MGEQEVLVVLQKSRRAGNLHPSTLVSCQCVLLLIPHQSIIRSAALLLRPYYQISFSVAWVV